MTLEDLAEKIDARFDKLEGKVDNINTTVALHTQAIAKDEEELKAAQERISKLERWMWWCLGAGGAAGVGVAKLFI